MINSNEASKLKTECGSLAALSYKCLEDNPVKGQEVCRSYFDDYKTCRKTEHTALIEQRRNTGATVR